MHVNESIMNVLKAELAGASHGDLLNLAARLEAVTQTAIAATVAPKKRGRPRKNVEASGAAAPIAAKGGAAMQAIPGGALDSVRKAKARAIGSPSAKWDRQLAKLHPEAYRRGIALAAALKAERASREASFDIERSHGRWGRVTAINGHSTAHIWGLQLEELLAQLRKGKLPREWHKSKPLPRNVVRLLPGTNKLLASASRNGKLVSDFYADRAA